MEDILVLQHLIDELSPTIHVSLLDVSGIASHPAFGLDAAHTTHTRPFCDAAKTTTRGLRLCLSCKALTVKKAIQSMRMFTGICPYGITETVCPVMSGGKLLCILYVGNVVCDSSALKKRINKVCTLTGVPPAALLEQTNTLSHQDSKNACEHIARLIQSYILLLFEHYKPVISSNHHWAVTSLQNYAALYYNRDLQLHRLARMLYLNENYLGRLFRKKTGVSFSEYVNSIRLSQACRLLTEGNDTVLAISLAVGFHNVAYFNRLFKRKMKKTPLQYRKQFDNSNKA